PTDRTGHGSGVKRFGEVWGGCEGDRPAALVRTGGGPGFRAAWAGRIIGVMGFEVRLSTQFRVLGPLEVFHDGAPVRLGGERQRALLALLLIQANALVTTEQLIEHLFGGARP